MNDLRKAAEMALDTMLSEYSTGGENKYSPWDVIEALRQALAQGEPWDASDMAHRAGGLSVEQSIAQPEQEPVTLESIYETIVYWDDGGGKRSRRELARRITELYTAPPSTSGYAKKNRVADQRA